MSQWQGSEERVYFQVHGLPQVFKLKIAYDSPLLHLFEHIPSKKYQPPLCIDGPEYVWRDILLDPLKTPEDYNMQTGERNVQTIHVNFPLVSPRTALHAQRTGGEESSFDDKETPRGETPRRGMALGSARLSIDGERRSPIPNSARAGESATPMNSRSSPRYGAATNNIPSVDKIIDDLTQALRGAEDEIEDLQTRYDAKVKQVEALKPERVEFLEADNARIKAELEAERRENDSKQEAIQILRNKISALEAAASRTQEATTSSAPQGNAAAEALATSLRHHCHSLEQELSHREEELRQLNAKVASMNVELDMARNSAVEELKNHKEALERLEATRNAMTKKDESSLTSEESLRVRIDRLERENAILQSDNTTLAQRVVAAETHKNELRGLRNQFEIETAAWNAQKNAFEKEIKALREKSAEQLLHSQRHEKVLSERNASLQEKIAFFEDPRSVNQREEEYQQRELEMRSRLRDSLAENDRLKTIHKDLKRQVSELETSLFECNNVLVRVQKENTDIKRAGVGSASGTPRVEGRLPASSRTMSAPQTNFGSPLPSTPQQATSAVANSKAAELALLHVDPFSLVKGTPVERSTSSPNVADALLLSRHGNGNGLPTAARLPSVSTGSAQRGGNAANASEFQDA